jgi:hypothetical protein
MMCVLATREGLEGGKTATGYRVEKSVPFVALPSDAALRQWVWVLNPRTQKRVKALVLDVGPWNEKDHQYVFQPGTLDPGISVPRHSGIRPQAETGFDTRGRKTNGAGIDLGESVYRAIAMEGNELVLWEFA